MVARGGSGTRGGIRARSFLPAAVDQTPRDFSLRVLRHALHALGSHEGSYIPSVRYTTLESARVFPLELEFSYEIHIAGRSIAPINSGQLCARECLHLSAARESIWRREFRSQRWKDARTHA